MKTILHWRTSADLCEFLNEVCHADADGYAVYDKDWNDQRVVSEFSESFGTKITKWNVMTMRANEIGMYRKVPGGIKSVRSGDFAELCGRVASLEDKLEPWSKTDPGQMITHGDAKAILAAQEELIEMLGNFRQVLHGQNQKIDAIRKVVEVAGIQQLESIYRAKDRLEAILSLDQINRDDLFQKMRGEGFAEGVTQSALVLLGAVIRGEEVHGPNVRPDDTDPDMSPEPAA